MLKTRLVGSGIDAGSQLRVQRSAGRALVAVLAMLAMQPALAGPIDLREFNFIDGDPVVLGSTDGTAAESYAVISESPSSSVTLFNEPGLNGAPVLINSADGPVLRFQYEFVSDPAGCVDLCDTFIATLFKVDPSVDGSSEILLPEFLLPASGFGEVSFFLSSYQLASNFVFGLQFELLSYDDIASASSVFIRGLEVYDPAAVTVPEPGSLALLLGGLIAMVVRRRAISC